MIFVIVGTHIQGFPRLIKELDRVAKGLNTKIIAQIGHNSYLPKNFEYFTFESEKKFKEYFKKADIIISHGGATVIEALLAGKRIVAVPRLEKFSEHSNDHQLEFTQKLYEQNLIELVVDIKDLGPAIKNAKRARKKGASAGTDLNNFIEGWINGLKP